MFEPSGYFRSRTRDTFWIAFGPVPVAFLAHEGWRNLVARDLDLPKDSDTPRDSMSSRDPLFQFVWDSIAHGEVELEMDDSTLGIGSLSVRVRVRCYSGMMRGGEQDLSDMCFGHVLHGSRGLRVGRILVGF